MKKYLFVFLLFASTSITAQKNNANGTSVKPNNGVTQILPDLTFDLIPVLSSSTGKGYEAVAGIPGRIKIPLRFIVKNIGNATSKSCKVELEILYASARTRAEIEQGIPANAFNRSLRSEPMLLQAIDKNKDELRNLAFLFTNFPEEVFGKRIKIIARIVYPNNTGELSSTNNSSTPYEFDLVK